MSKYLILLLFISFTKCQNNEILESKLKNKDSTNILIKPAIYTIYFYQNYLGKIKGSYCPMYPSCSEYGRIAISKYNLKGILMTFDRLNRCSHDLENYNLIFIDGKLKYSDEPN